MDANAIKERIGKAQEVIDRKNMLIEKRFKTIGKIYAKIGKTCGMSEDYTATVEFADRFYQAVKTAYFAHRAEIEAKYGSSDSYYSHLTEGIWEDVEDSYIESVRNAYEEIENRKAQIAKYEEQMDSAMDRDAVFESMPACMKEFMEGIIECWDLWDKMKRESAKNDHVKVSELWDERARIWRDKGKNSPEYLQINEDIRYIEGKYTSFEWNELPYLDDDEIHERNVKAGKNLVMNLYTRVVEITGGFEDASDLKVTAGNNGCAVINGWVKGEKGIASVKSVGAGGWNIQRFHIRTLVHKVRN